MKSELRSAHWTCNLIFSLGCAAAGLLIITCTFVIVEGYFRVFKNIPNGSDRYLVPYLVTGNWRGNTNPIFPPASGYENAGASAYFNYEKPVNSISDWAPLIFAERKEFLTSENPKHLFRVFLVGSSTVLGDGASTDDRRWWRQLEVLARKTFHRDDIVIVPVAMPSFVSTQERLALELFVFPMKPDAVIVVDGNNDIMTHGTLVRPGDPYNQGILFKQFSTFSFPLWKWVAERSALARYYLLKNIELETSRRVNAVFASEPLRENYLNGVANVYVDNVSAMSKRCKQEKVPCFIFLQPNRNITAKVSNPQDMRSRDYLAYERILKQREKAGLTKDLIDLAHIFDRNPGVYVDGVHFNDEGQEIFAAEILKFVQGPLGPLLRLKKI